MLSSAEIRLILFHEIKLGNNVAAAKRNITKAWGKGTVNERTTQRWFKKFGSGDTTLRTQPGYGRKSDVDDGNLKPLVEADSSRTIRDLADDIGVHCATVSRHLQEMGKIKKLDKWVPHELNDRQKKMNGTPPVRNLFCATVRSRF
ncbi:hypothetical protein Y032_0299g1780 [Ancylostoma ceylanicum]|uniref:Mos1 transposase HTH domain-containing protein n=1 Tax=Ancylostoma ceylanicum TaxID=53326 RepID=A0A016S4W1_9BILA|nr:hypothetical protein Y032_0299g1780 [Ancylostoma ceylanicum]